MDITQRRVAMVLVYLFLGSSSAAVAQDAPDGGLGDDKTTSGEVGAEAAPSDAAEPAPAASEAPAEAPAASADLTVHVSADASASAAKVDGAATAPVGPLAAPADPVLTGSHIRRPRLMPDGALVIDSALTTEMQGRESLQMRRQLGGAALPDTSAALGQGGSGTSRIELRQQPTLVLLNGRRLVSAPYSGPFGADFVDINQLPISLIERVETTKGLTAGLYGDGAIGGTVNYVTRRSYDGIEIDLGGQATDDFDQHEEDVTLTLGTGNETNGVSAMVSYFTRQPLGATDSDWIGGRDDRVKSLQGSPGTYQQLTNFDYPFPDPSCEIATGVGDASGLEVRLRGFGPPETLGMLPDDVQATFLMDNDVARGKPPTQGDGKVDAYETGTYCAANLTKFQDLVLKDERIQTYSTFWHKFTDHTEGFGELGYYRSNNENRTAPSFPVIRLMANTNLIRLTEDMNPPVWVPKAHADQPVQEKGFATADVETGRVSNDQFLVGRVIGPSAGADVNKRRVDVFRGVLGLRGDLKDVGAGSVLESWDWELSGLYSSSDAISTTHDTLLDKLATALASCQATTGSERQGFVPTTIKQRQEAGCFNPFYSSIVNNGALDPLGVSKSSAASENGFITTDTDPPGDDKYGAQDGGYICDPNDPGSPPCPAEFDRDGDGVFELAGTPNTKQVMDRITGEQITIQNRSLATADGVVRGDLAEFADGGLSFGAGAQFRRETVDVDYDAAYNQRLYGFLYGAPDVPHSVRNVAAGFAELRLRVLKGLIEVQPAARVEYFDDVGTAVNPLVGVALRPFASSSAPPPALEWLIVRGHIGQALRAPSLLQLHGSQTEFQSVEFTGRSVFVPQFLAANPNLDFEKYTTISGGVQWDFVGIHVGADFWTTGIDDVIASDNAQTLIRDCEQQYTEGKGECREAILLPQTRTLEHLESSFDNIAKVSTNGIDGGVSYTLDTKKRGLGDVGTFMLGAQGTYLNSYLIKSARALREFYRAGGVGPVISANGARDYSKVSSEYEAAGYRNLDNFAPPLPKLRFAIPLRWQIGDHTLGLTMRYIGGYNDDSESTIERRGLFGNYDTSKVTKETYGRAVLAVAEGEVIPAWTVFDANYGFSFGDDAWKTKLAVGVINLLDADPPAVESPLGYEVGIHDPRGRVIYVRATGEF